MNVPEFLKTFGAALAIIGTMFGGYFYIDNRYALAESQERLEVELEIVKLNGQKREVKSEVLFLRQQLRKYHNDQELKDELGDTQDMLKDIESELKLNKQKREKM